MSTGGTSDATRGGFLARARTLSLRATVCPWCRERVRPESPDAPCPACGHALQQEGVAVRPVDVAADGVVAAQDELYGRMLAAGVAAAFAVALGMQLLHVAAALAPLFVAVHLVLVRLLLIRRSYLLLGPARRVFNRWILRLSFLWVGVPGWALGATPAIGVLAPPAVFAGLTALAHYYTRSSVDRERQRLPLLIWEKIVLGTLVAATLAAIVLLVVFAGLLWVAFEWVRSQVTWP